MKANKSKRRIPTETENTVFTQHGIEDSTLLSDKQLAEMQPLSEVLPELVNAQKNATLVVKPMGRPRSENPKQSITIRLSSEVTEYFRATGKGWQTRVDEALLEYVKKHR